MVGTSDISSSKMWKLRSAEVGLRSQRWAVWSQISSAGSLCLEPNDSAWSRVKRSKTKWQFLSSFLTASGQVHAQIFVAIIRPWGRLQVFIEGDTQGPWQGRARAAWYSWKVDPWATKERDRVRRAEGWQVKGTG